MRPIDADALYNFFLEMHKSGNTCDPQDVLKAITNAPTIQREGWQPIKTAPKGEAVLVAGGDCDYPCVANYSGHLDECWCVDGQMDTYTEIGWPMYWMPLDSLPVLPAAPTDKE